MKACHTTDDQPVSLGRFTDQRTGSGPVTAGHPDTHATQPEDHGHTAPVPVRDRRITVSYDPDDR